MPSSCTTPRPGARSARSRTASAKREARYERFHAEEGPDLAFSPDGKRCSSWQHELLASGTRPRASFSISSAATPVQSRVSRSAPTAGRSRRPAIDSTIRLWDVASGAERALLRGHTAWIGYVAFHPDGWSLLSGGRHHAEVKLWDLTRPQEFLSLAHCPSYGFIFDEGGRRLKLVSDLGRLQTREIESGMATVGPLVDMSRQWLTPAALAEYSGMALRLATAAANRLHVKVWDAKLRERAHDAHRPDRAGNLPFRHPRWQSSRRRGPLCEKQLSLTRGQGMGHRAGKTARVVHPVKRTDAVHVTAGSLSVLMASSSLSMITIRRLASRTPRVCARVKVCDVTSGQQLLSLPAGNSIVYCLAFSPDGKVLAVDNQDGEMSVWDVSTGERRHKQKQSDFTSGSRLAPTASDWQASIVKKSRCGMRVTARKSCSSRVPDPRRADGGFNPLLAWSQDGQQLASFNWDGSVSVWSATVETETVCRPAKRGRRPCFRLASCRGRNRPSPKDSAAAAAFHLSRLLAAQPPDITSLTRRGVLPAPGRWEQARADLARWYQSGEADEGEAWLDYARLLIALGDSDGYRKVCTRMLEVFEQNPRLPMAHATAHAIGLAPGPQEEAVRAVTLAEKELGDRRDAGRQFSLALAHFSAGHVRGRRRRTPETGQHRATRGLALAARAGDDRAPARSCRGSPATTGPRITTGATSTRPLPDRVRPARSCRMRRSISRRTVVKPSQCSNTTNR